MQLLKETCYQSFCSALVQDISWDELKIAEKVFVIILKLLFIIILIKYNKK